MYVHVCMYVGTHVCMYSMYVYMYLCRLHVFMCVRIYENVHVYRYVGMYLRMCVCMYV